MSIIQASNASGGSYSIDNSLRFRAGSSANLSRTLTTSATWTLSAWVKRGALGVIAPLLGDGVKFLAEDTLVAGSLTTTALFRDPGAWYHIHVSNGGLYVNGVNLGAVTTSALTNPKIGSNGTNYFDGYLAEVSFVDGSSVSYTNFGQADALTGQWIPKAYSGTYGALGFYLKFNDGTNLTNLCLDRSGNGNNWTASGTSLTDGPTYDWMTDTPTNNFATLTPLSKAVAYATMVDGNLSGTFTAVNNAVMAGYSGTGKFYFEVSTAGAAAQIAVGLCPIAKGPVSINCHYLSVTGLIYTNNVSQVTAATWANGDIIGVAYDTVAGTATFYKNGVSQGTANLPSDIDFVPEIYQATNASNTVYMNLGQRPFRGTYVSGTGSTFVGTGAPPTGYKALCAANVSTPATINPKKHFDIVTRVGFGASGGSVSSLQFQPDLLWTKGRNAVSSNYTMDSVRGVGNSLSTDQTIAEAAGSFLSAFTANGYTINSADYPATTTVVEWLWKADGTAVTNTSGTITSQVSANTTAGFSIVTYTGTGANATVGHGLGVAPKLILFKSRNSVINWGVYSESIGNQYALYLNLTDAKTGPAAFHWNNTSPTTAVFSVGTGTIANTSATNYVAYCFAEVPGFSKIGSYTGNANVNGVFVHCGFKPKYIMIKDTANITDWKIHDTARDPYNQVIDALATNTSAIEAAYGASQGIDVVSNGFKIRMSGTPTNAATTHIFIAFAESPFNYATAR